jgi:hypothetical protein
MLAIGRFIYQILAYFLFGAIILFAEWVLVTVLVLN